MQLTEEDWPPREVQLQSIEVLDILSEYTDVSATVNLNKLLNWMKADDEEEFKKMLPSLQVDQVSKTDFLIFLIFP